MPSVSDLVALMRQARFAEAREVWISLGDLRLTHPALLEAGASIHEQLGEHGMAAELWARLADQRPDHATTWAALGEASQSAGDLRGAVEAWRRVRTLAPESPEPLVRMALLLEDLRDRAGARAAASEAVRLAPELVVPQRLLLRLDHQERRLEEAHLRATALLSRELRDVERAALLLELAVIERRRKNYDAAFQAAARGNALAAASHKEAGWSLEAYPGLLERILPWRGRRGLGSGSGPRRAPVFMVGFPRSGTTLAQQILQAHPAVQTLDEVDPAMAVLRAHLSSRTGRATYPGCLDDLSDSDWHHLRAAYWEAVDARGLGYYEVLVDKLPLNLVRVDYLVRLFPGCRVLVILRDPRDSVLSNFLQDYEPNTAMVQCTDLHRTARMYAGVMDIWLDRRPHLPVPWREQRYEELAADTEAQAASLLEFLGLPWDPAVLSHHRAAADRVISTPSRYDVSRPVYRTAVGRWRHFERHLRPILPLLAPYIEALGYDQT